MKPETEHLALRKIEKLHDRILNTAADILANDEDQFSPERNKHTTAPKRELKQFLQDLIEKYCDEVWDNAADIVANDNWQPHHLPLQDEVQASIEQRFDEVSAVWDKVADILPNDKLYGQEPNATRPVDITMGNGDVVIAVMGVTGAGKSSFVKKMTGRNDVYVGHSLSSATTEIESYSFTHKGINFTLVDTPGFDDSSKSDKFIVNLILEWLASSFRDGIRLTGILYLHRIIDPRIGGGAYQNMRMFRKLCGPDCMKNIVLGTTFWGSIAPEKGAMREKELASRDEFWGKMAKKGSKVVRIEEEDRESGLEILLGIAKNDSFVPQAQREMIEHSKSASETSAAKSMSEELEKMKREMEAQAQAQREVAKRQLTHLDAERKVARKEEKRKKEEIAAAKAKADTEELARAQEEYWDHYALQQQLAEIAADEACERQIVEDNRMARVLRAEAERLEKEARIAREERQKYYASYSCRRRGNNTRSCDKCGCLMRGKYSYYHCCHCVGDDYNHCIGCGDHCQNPEHARMRWLDEAGCVIM